MMPLPGILAQFMDESDLVQNIAQPFDSRKRGLNPMNTTEGVRMYPGGGTHGLPRGAHTGGRGWNSKGPASQRKIDSLQKRLRDSGDDEELLKIVNEAAKHGIDWSSLLY